MRYRSDNLFLQLLFAGAFLASCASVKLVSQYDERLDNGVSDFQRQMDFFLLRLKSDSGKAQARHENRLGFYDSMRVDLNILRVRSEIKPKNSRTSEQIQLLEKSLETLFKLHESYVFIPPSQIGSIQSGFDRSCGAILKFELEKKRGENNGRN